MSLASAMGDALGPERARLDFGTVVAVNASTGAVTVNVGGVDQSVLWVADAGWSPSQGDGVAVLRQGQELIVIGTRTRHLPPYGTVTSTASSTTVTVTVPGAGSMALPFVTSYTPRTVGDVVRVAWSGGSGTGVVMGKLSTAPITPTEPAPAPKPPPPAPTTGVRTFPARSAGTYRSGVWRGDANGNVIQGTYSGYPGANSGAWFYHGQPQATLAGATVAKAEIWLGRTSGGVYAAQDCHLQRVTNDVRPGGALTFTGGVDNVPLKVGQTGWFTISTAMVQAIVDSGGSIGIQNDPYLRMFGIKQDPRAGTLRITWRR